MHHTRNILLSILLGACVISLVLVVAYECGWLPLGNFADKIQFGFYAAVVMELLTICLIPFALRLFKFRYVHFSLALDKEKALQKWGSIRLLMLCIPMIINTLCYYFFMNVAFAYMAIILFLCLFFVFPTLDRCYADIPEFNDNQDDIDQSPQNSNS